MVKWIPLLIILTLIVGGVIIMAIKHEKVVSSGDKGEAADWNASHVIDGHVDFNKYQAEQLVVHKGTSFPSNPVKGQPFYRTDENILYVYDDSNWVPVHSFYDQWQHVHGVTNMTYSIGQTRIVSATKAIAAHTWEYIFLMPEPARPIAGTPWPGVAGVDAKSFYGYGNLRFYQQYVDVAGEWWIYLRVYNDSDYDWPNVVGYFIYIVHAL